MSDRRAVSAGRLGASSVAVANEPWRVAIGGNRVQSMTVEQIAQAYRAGQLTARTPLWPPGASGWQALGNFEQFQSAPIASGGGFDGNAAQLTQFEEADDAPTRMWTGSGDLSELEMSPGALGAGSAASAPAAPIVPPPRPSARTGTRPVAGRAQSVAAQPVRNSSTVPGLATTRASVPPRSSGLWLVAGLVGLVALGSAVLAVRGSWSAAASSPTSTPELSADSSKRSVAAASGDKHDSASAAPHGAEVNQAQLAKYEDPPAVANPAAATPKPEAAPAAATGETKSEPAAAAAPSSAAPEPVAPEAPRASRHSNRSESSRAARRRHEREHEAASEARAVDARASAEKSTEPKVSSAAASKRDSAAAAELPKSKSAKSEAKADSQAVSAAVNDAAATALTNASKLAASCRPPGGPSGEGKARVIYSQDGDVQSVEILTAKFRDTLTGSCVRMVFRRAKIPPFRGEPPTFIKSFKIPEE